MDLNNLDSTNSKSYIQLEGRHVRKNKSSGFRILPSWEVERFNPFENYDSIVSQNGWKSFPPKIWGVKIPPKNMWFEELPPPRW